MPRESHQRHPHAKPRGTLLRSLALAAAAGAPASAQTMIPGLPPSLFPPTGSPMEWAPAPGTRPTSGAGVGSHTNPKAAAGPMPAVVDAQPGPVNPEGGSPAAGASASSIHVSDDLTVDMHLTDETLANVLQMLAIQTQKNIVASKGVNATVTANLYGVTLNEALDSILNVNGYGYIERGNFIYVYTLEELQQIKQADRRPIAKVILLNYLNANDAAQFVAPLLSEIGQIKTNGDVATFSIQDKPVGDERFALSATLVVFDFPEHVEEIEKLVRQLDSRPAQVLVEATILQTKLTEANAFGVDFSVIAGLDFTDFIPSGGPLSVFRGIQAPPAQDSTANLDAQGTAIVGTPGNTAGPGTLKVGIVNDDFSVFVKLLDEVSDTTVLSNPKVLALNRQPAKVLVGRKIGYLSTTATETATTQTVEFLDTGTQLAFRPFISNDGMIRMELRPSVSQGFIRVTNDSNGQPVSIPDEETQELTTNVLVRDGATIVLGGLFKETTELSRRQVPVLGDIPVIGAAFRGHEDDTDRVEIIFLITPTIVNDKSMLAQGERGMATVERVRAGTRQGLLPWSRERMSAQLNVEAEALARGGKTEEALWKLRRSLELNPVQPEAMRLREQLLGARTVWPSRSFLEEVIGGEARTKIGDVPVGPDSTAWPIVNAAPALVPTTQSAGATPDAEPVEAPAGDATASGSDELDTDNP